MDAMQFLETLEHHLNGAFSENTVKSDLETRAAQDRYSAMGSGGRTNALGEKKQFYIHIFNEMTNDIRRVLADPSFSAVKSRFEKCLQKIAHLHDIVDNF